MPHQHPIAAAPSQPLLGGRGFLHFPVGMPAPEECFRPSQSLLQSNLTLDHFPI
jgi:hypothetical protein